MPIKDNREYRSIELRAIQDEEEKSYKVSGYATTFDSPYVMFTDEEGNEYKETISSKAFKEADMSDVIFLYNHEGMVYARQKNGTLVVENDEHGMKVTADLGSTKQSRELFEAIESGLIDQMSWAFTVDADEYDKKTRTRTITKVRKVYDVSAVSIPANDQTSIGVATRDYFAGVSEIERAERLERAKQMQRIKIKAKLED